MAIENLILPQSPLFNVLNDASTLFTGREKYKKRFNLLWTVVGVTDKQQNLFRLLT